MKQLWPTYLACAVLALAAVLGGCTRKPAANVLASVGGKDITVADFQAEYERRQAMRQPLPDRQTLLEQMIGRETLLQQARAVGLDQTADVRRACEDVLIARYQQTQVAPKIAAAKVSPEEIKAVYQRDLAHYTQPAKVKLAIVLVAVSPKADTNQVAAAAARARDALARTATLRAGTQGFGQIAADCSDDQLTRYRGGDAGWFANDGLEGRWPREIVAAGFALKNAGDLSEVLRGGEGFYVVKKLDSRPAGITPLEQVRPAIERRLLIAKQEEVERQLSAAARATAKVSTNVGLLAAVKYPNQSSGKNAVGQFPYLPVAP